MQAEGGNFSVDSCDDALHSNNSILISGGIYQLSTGDDGVHADTKLTVSGGEMEIAKSFEGLESSEIENATIRITSQDDGINISGGSDGETVGPRGRDSFQPASGDGRLVIGSGYLAVDASGDGIDINGSGEMNGGTLIIHGPESGGDSALDYDGGFSVNGGTLIAAGSAQMAQYPSEQSGQGFIVVSCSSENPAGTLFSLQDSGGSEIVTFEAQKRVQSLIVNAPDLKGGESYLLCTGGSSTAEQTDGLYENGGYQGGESQIAFDMESNAVYLDENGVTTQPGGAGGFGGGNRRDMARPDNGQGEGGARPQGEARDGGRGMQ